MNYPFLFILLILCLSCAPLKSIKREVAYNFSYRPYDSINVIDRNLYNYVFNIIRNKLIFFVSQTLPSHPDLIGLVIELETPESKKDFEQIMRGSCIRGWSIFDTDCIPLSDSEINDFNNSFFREEIAHSQKAYFTISTKKDNATVYVRFWILQYRNYNFIYQLKKGERWEITQTEDF